MLFLSAAACLLSGLTQAATQRHVHTMGASIEVVPDVDGDRFPELVVAATTDLPRTSFLLSGRDGSLVMPLPTMGEHPLDDVDGDGVVDLLEPAMRFGSPRVSGVALRSGATGATLRLDGEPHPDASFGTSILVVPDEDGDGVRDYWASLNGISAPVGHRPEWRPGCVLVSGATGTALRFIPLAPLVRFPCRQLGTRWCELGPVGLLGDLDCDGRSDLLLGRFETDDQVLAVSSATGEALLHIDGRAGHSIRISRRHESFEWGDHSAWGIDCQADVDLVGLGDLDGDGVDDLGVSLDAGVSCFGFGGLEPEPDARCLVALSTASLGILWDRGTLAPDGSGELGPMSLARTLDFDADGRGDLLVGQPHLLRWCTPGLPPPSVSIVSAATGRTLGLRSIPGELIGTCAVAVEVPEKSPWIVTGGSFLWGGHFQDMPGFLAAFRADGSVAWTTSGPEIEAAWRELGF